MPKFLTVPKTTKSVQQDYYKEIQTQTLEEIKCILAVILISEPDKDFQAEISDCISKVNEVKLSIPGFIND